ncbi:mannosidase, beta A, lysosomal [Planoprotostelium fungivorum]|uniref:Beta-mannosidase B n=1 Tax=Planoprotostelium fungivorum TaxID=1890364 RepID=A0A2P6N7N6_9EUKA|nr:mannosidase, beta A, lysosomal [Planoprotostelium fungivorum]
MHKLFFNTDTPDQEEPYFLLLGSSATSTIAYNALEVSTLCGSEITARNRSKMRKTLCTFLLLALLPLFNAETPLFDLDLGGTWKLTNLNGSIQTQGQVPGDIFGDLLREGILTQEPYFRYNDVLYRWVGMDSWTWSRTFEAPQRWQGHRVILYLDGVDTIATVKVNDQVVLNADNMYLRYQIDVTDIVKLNADNHIEISFACAATYAEQKKNEYPYAVPSYDGPLSVTHGVDNRNFIRKESSSFSWDWGPAFIPQGIYKDIGFRLLNQTLIDYVVPSITKKSETSWVVNTSVILRSEAAGQVVVSSKIGEDTVVSISTVAAGETIVYVQHNVESPKLWWPVGYGEQPLYQQVVEVRDTQGYVFDSKEHHIAFRTARLVTDPIEDLPGNRWMYFEINGVAVFAKGANFIPSDSFESRVTDESLRDILIASKEANMNIVRIWGGGIYQRDSFYRMADEMGIMIWQEFMFACAMYPRDKAFLENVRSEIQHQVRRLSHHASIILWSGNNENEVAFGWGPITLGNEKLYAVDYAALYLDTIYPAIQREDTTRDFWPSSPSNGFASMEPLVGAWGDGGDVTRGDVHFYDYNMMCTDVNNFKKTKFASEYGFQSQESSISYSSVVLPEDWSWNSSLMNHRQHHPEGQEQMLAEVKMHFSVSDAVTSGKGREVFERWAYLTQSMQSVCIKAQSEFYRRGRGTEARTMGAIYWQLNSIWQAPTWSSLEYGGRWKMLHYFVKNFFSPVLISSYQDKDNMVVHVTSDVNEPIEGAIARLTVWPWSGAAQVNSVKVPVNLKALESGQILVKSFTELLNGGNASDHFVTLELFTRQGEVLSRNEFYFTTLKEASLQSPNVTTSSFSANRRENKITFTVSSIKPAPYTWLSTEIEGRFSDNGFLVIPSESKRITFVSKEAVSAAELAKSLQITVMADE